MPKLTRRTSKKSDGHGKLHCAGVPLVPEQARRVSGAAALPRLQLRRNEDRRVRQGHCWVYSNEIDTNATPLKGLAPGMQAELCASNGKSLAVVHVNPHALICARVLCRDVSLVVDGSFLAGKLRAALRLRERLFAAPFYRMVYGDSDELPGLIVDRYDTLLVVQIATAGMEAMLDDIVAALVDLLAPAGILLRNDGSIRELNERERRNRICG